MKTFIAETVYPEVGDPYETIPVYKWNECQLIDKRDISQGVYEEVRKSVAGTLFRIIRGYK